MTGYVSPWRTPQPAKVYACESPTGHVWEEADYAAGCELCGEHHGWRCSVDDCYETVDAVWHDAPREVDPIVIPDG